MTAYSLKFPNIEYVEEVLDFIDKRINSQINIEIEKETEEFLELMKG